MMSESLAAIERLWRRMLLVVGRGRIKTSDDIGALQRHQVQLGQLETFDNLSRLSEYGFNSLPPEKSEAVLLFMGGNRTDGVIIATGNQTYRMRGLANGEVSISDDKGQSVYLSQNGIVINGGGKPITVINTQSVTLDTPETTITGHVTIKGALDVDGSISSKANIAAQGNVSDTSGKTMAGMRNVYNQHGHPAHSQPPTQKQ
jgi:phage baseplate assembly protein V